MGLVLRPVDETPGIPAIREDMLDEGEPGSGPCQNTLCSIAVLNVRGVNLDGQQPAVGVRQDMTLAPMDLLARVVAFESPF